MPSFRVSCTVYLWDQLPVSLWSGVGRMRAGSSGRGYIFYLHWNEPLLSQWLLPSLSAPRGLHCHAKVIGKFKIHNQMMSRTWWQNISVNFTEQWHITWHFDSVNVGFFETLADCQDVRHLCCCHILSFPPVRKKFGQLSNTNREVKYSVCFSFYL